MTESLMTPEDLGVIDPNKDYYADLVGEGKKYKDNAALARSKMEADLMIKSVLREKSEVYEDYKKLKEQYEAGLKLQEVLDRVSNLDNQGRPTLPQEPNDQDKTPAIKPEDIESLVSQKIQSMEIQKREADNFNQVKAKLKERFGESFQSVVSQQVEALGLSDEDVTALAKKSPTAFFRTLGLDQPSKDGFQTPPRSEINMGSFKPNTIKRTWSYYEKMRRENPTVYHNPKTQAQMFDDVKELGEQVFYDSN